MFYWIATVIIFQTVILFASFTSLNWRCDQDERKAYNFFSFFPQRSYLFQNRPLTPPRYIKQDEYSKDLGGQVSVDFFALFKC